MTDLTEKTLATERKYTGKIISVDLLDIELPDGRKAKREVIRHGNAVAIVAHRPDGKFVFVKQYRKAAEEALIEVIAGGLEPGEDPIEGARRETAEETGYEVTSIKFLTTIICTPGYCEERIHNLSFTMAIYLESNQLFYHHKVLQITSPQLYDFIPAFLCFFYNRKNRITMEHSLSHYHVVVDMIVLHCRLKRRCASI